MTRCWSRPTGSPSTPDDPAYRLVEVDEDTAAYAGRPHPQRHRVALEGRPARAAPARVPRPGGACRALLGRSGVGPDTTVVLYGGNNNWFATYAYWCCSVPGLRPGQADGRRAQEVGARGPRARRPTCRRSRGRPRRARPARQSSAPSATTCSSTSAARARRWWTCAARPSSRGEVLAPPHLPQEQAQVPGHIPGAANVPWASAAREDGSFKTDEELTPLRRRRRRPPTPT